MLKLLVDLENSDPEEGGALIPFIRKEDKPRLSNEKFLKRLVMTLEIPTYNT